MKQFICALTIDAEGPVGFLGKMCAVSLAREEFGIEHENWSVGSRGNKTVMLFKSLEDMDRFEERLTEAWG